MMDERDGVRALLIPVGEYPREIWLECDEDGEFLRSMQDAVGDSITAFTPLKDDLGGAMLYCGDNGIAEGAAPNRGIYMTERMVEAGYYCMLDYSHVAERDELYGILFGDILAVGIDRDTGEMLSLSDVQAAAAKEYFTKVSVPSSGEAEYLRILDGMGNGHAGWGMDEFNRDLIDGVLSELGIEGDDIAVVSPWDIIETESGGATRRKGISR